MKRVLIACILLTVLLAGCLIGCRSIHRITDISLSSAEEAEKAATRADFNTAGAQLRAGRQNWTRSRALLSALLDLRTIEEIDILFQRSITFADAADRVQLLSELVSLSASLNAIKAAALPIPENIF